MQPVTGVIMGKTFEALNRAEKQKKIRLNELSAGYNGIKTKKLIPFVSMKLIQSASKN